MKIAVVSLVLHVAAASGHVFAKTRLRVNGIAVAPSASSEVDKPVHLLKDASHSAKTSPEQGKLIPKVQQHTQDVVQQDVDNVNRVAKGDAPEVVPNVPEPVETAVEEDVETVRHVAKGDVEKVSVDIDVDDGKPEHKKQRATKEVEEEQDSDEPQKLPPLKEFLPSCLSHTAEIVQTIDRSYSDQQIQFALQNQCTLSKQFPTVVEDAFRNHKACMDFAEQLSTARHGELADGSTDGYNKFCHDFYRHHTGLDSPPSRSAGYRCSVASFSIIALVVMLWC
jgi:hypothetical protein